MFSKLKTELKRWTLDHISHLNLKITELENQINSKEPGQYLTSNNTVKCDVCSCLLYKDDAIKGESRIVEKYKQQFSDGWGTYFSFGFPKEEIETPYYCHKCKEKDESKSGTNTKNKR